jgi:rfaE bifunctional protein nucleotidyltransferase chain/domain
MTKLEQLQKKIANLNEAKLTVQTWKNDGLKVVFTNGCFDILHKGHVVYLTQAADLGDKLVVGLNTDASVKRQGKGDDRPINSEDARLAVLAGLQAVDLVVLFDADTPLDLIRAIQPNTVAKGSDYDPNETDATSKKYIVGKDVMQQMGGEVVAIPLVEGFSTTGIIEMMKKD